MTKSRLLPIIIGVAVVITAVVVVNMVMGNSTPAPPNGGNSTPTNSIPTQNTTGISPGKVFVDNYVPGKSAPYELVIYNANDAPTAFSVDYRVPDWVGENCSRPTSEVRDWVWISDKRPVVPAHGTFKVDISLGMPSYATAPGKSWEFWIGVIDQSQTGMIQVELAQRWLITMQ